MEFWLTGQLFFHLHVCVLVAQDGKRARLDTWWQVGLTHPAEVARLTLLRVVNITCTVVQVYIAIIVVYIYMYVYTHMYM